MAGEGAVDRILASLGAALARGEGVSRRPSATYRLQLHAGFGFDAAREIVPYLAALGVSDLYLSPILAAAPGSTHGYDVVDHGRLNPELGGEEAFRRLALACRERGLGVLVDFVPNHMGIGRHNAWWMDVLENGPSSVHAPAFDVDWAPLEAELANKVLVPVLGDQFGKVLERGELALERDGGAFWIRYFDHCFPVAPRSVPSVLRLGLDALRARLGEGHPAIMELESVAASLEKLAPRIDTRPEAIADRAREKEVAKRRLAALCESSAPVREHLDENVRRLNGTPGDPRSFDALEHLLGLQAYRLAFWRVAGEEINYRRFFDVNGLAAIRMEEPRVFADAHRLVLDLVRDGLVTGLRIDHPDGLYAPPAYFRRLQAAHLLRLARRLADGDGARADDDALLGALFEALEAGRLPPRPLYVVAEKVLVGAEAMPEGWDVDGTTGYEFLAAASGLFVDAAAERPLERLWLRVSGRRTRFEETAAEKKRLVMSSSMASEIHVLAHRLDRLSEMNRNTRDFTRAELTLALVEFVALFPVYRTYVTRRGEVEDRDRDLVERTAARARRRSPVVDASVFDFLRDVLLQRYPQGLSEAERAEWLELTLKLQQVTGPVTAKAVEDTAFYTDVRLASLNEVGGAPDRFGTTPDGLHALLAERRERFPASLSATSTHDTKRSEDVRLRISALSELPQEWAARVARWSRLNRGLRGASDGTPAPDRVDELLLYQTLLGVMPHAPLEPGTPDHAELVARVQAYMEKAIREAKVHTSWTNPDEAYEAGVRAFVARALGSATFLAELRALAARVAPAARVSSLALTALKCAAPGVPDVYQGTELWDLSLVDPDNRRPVDFERRRALLAALDAQAAAGPGARAALARTLSSPGVLADGRAKLWLLACGLRLRRDRPALFLEGEHWPLRAEGPDAAHVFAFARVHATGAVVCAVPRLVLGALEAGGGRARWDAALPLPGGLPGRWTDVISGERREGGTMALARLWEDFPVALLASEA
ncbi:MAG: malto-oligosyltrehalose synthase [Anaeromyxobacteraceae bacterium]